MVIGPFAALAMIFGIGMTIAILMFMDEYKGELDSQIKLVGICWVPALIVALIFLIKG